MTTVKSNEQFRLIITGGGTGGHLFPAIAVAEQFCKKYNNIEVMFIGAGRSMDKKALAGRGFISKKINCGGLKGGSLLSKLKSLASLPLGLLQAMAAIRSFRPHLVFGVGGYVTGPVVIAAKMMGIPACIHEQNSVPGMANRKLGRFVDKVFLSIPGSEIYFPDKCILSGNPVRQAFLDIRRGRDDNLFDCKGNNLVLVVIGGSQGAHRLNCLVPEAVSKIINLMPRDLQVVHQTGSADHQIVLEAYEGYQIPAVVEPFFDDMADVLKIADLVVCRAGATTLAELTVLSKPSILVPFPYAADDHQTKNAAFLTEHGAAKMFQESHLDAEVLAEEILALFQDEYMRSRMASESGKMARPQAAEVIVDECMKLLKS